MSIQKDIAVRYRAEGHVRFEIPEQLCSKNVAQYVSAGVLAIDGVYKVDLFRKHKKLSIRFHETVCDFKELAKQFHLLLLDLDEKGLLVAQPEPEAVKKSKWNLGAKFKNYKAGRWASEKYSDAKETVQAAKIVTKVGFKKRKLLIADPEKAIIDFLNDILVLYLIKLHWTRITQQWIPNPWLHKSHWTAVFYLFYLLMRSRRPK